MLKWWMNRWIREGLSREGLGSNDRNELYNSSNWVWAFCMFYLVGPEKIVSIFFVFFVGGFFLVGVFSLAVNAGSLIFCE